MFQLATGSLFAALATAVAVAATATPALELNEQQRADVEAPPARLTPATCCAVVELRQYLLHPGQRDVLIELFEREFVEGQEAVGMRIFGQFRDLDNPDRFVWVRGFADMRSRLHALNAFYYGAVWQAHRNAANATLLDNDDVLLLRPGSAQSGFSMEAPPSGPGAPRLVIATIYQGKRALDGEFTRWFESVAVPVLAAAGARPIAWFENETAENTFPRLSVRTGENVFVWFAAFDDEAAYRRVTQQLDHSTRWKREIADQLDGYLASPPQRLRLEPTSNSRLR